MKFQGSSGVLVYTLTAALLSQTSQTPPLCKNCHFKALLQWDQVCSIPGAQQPCGSGFNALPKVRQGCSERQDKNHVLSTMVAKILANQFIRHFFFSLCDLLTDPVLAPWVLQALYQTAVAPLPSGAAFLAQENLGF